MSVNCEIKWTFLLSLFTSLTSLCHFELTTVNHRFTCCHIGHNRIFLLAGPFHLWGTLSSHHWTGEPITHTQPREIPSVSVSCVEANSYRIHKLWQVSSANFFRLLVFSFPTCWLEKCLQKYFCLAALYYISCLLSFYSYFVSKSVRRTYIITLMSIYMDCDLDLQLTPLYEYTLVYWTNW